MASSLGLKLVGMSKASHFAAAGLSGARRYAGTNTTDKMAIIQQRLNDPEFSRASFGRKVKLHEEHKKHRKFPSDTGSPEAQAAFFTARINYLHAHMQRSRKDYPAEKALLALHNKRRTMLKYLARKDPERTQELMEEWGIRKL